MANAEFDSQHTASRTLITDQFFIRFMEAETPLIKCALLEDEDLQDQEPHEHQNGLL